MTKNNSFKDGEKKRYNDTLIGSKYLYGDKGNGKYHPKLQLLEETNNIFRPSLVEVLEYFSRNNIKWFKIKDWAEDGSRPTKHILSSQVACINHLFPIREDKTAVLAIAQAVDSDISDVVLLENDKEGTKGYISFEVVSNNDYLNEDSHPTGKLNRGEFCTSIDALIIGIRNGRRVMLVIEWKYTESYSDLDKSKEDNVQGFMSSGDIRLMRYTDLILNSKYIKAPQSGSLRGSIFFYEPFYQLTRQTLWAEQMILHKDLEILNADDYVIVHVIPSANYDLLHKVYSVSEKMMEASWRGNIKDQGKYQIIAPEDLFCNIDRDSHKDLIDYLENRYWVCDKR